MKLGQIIASKAALEFAYTLRLKNGARALRLRKLIAKTNVELAAFETLRNDYIKVTGKDSLLPTDPEYDDVVRMINEALAEETEIVVEPLIDETDLEGVEASAYQLEGLYQLGLMIEPAEAEPEQQPLLD